MKNVLLQLWIFCLPGFFALGQTNESVLKLTGILSLPDFKLALLESPGPPRGEGLITLSEGERRSRAEVLPINCREGSVDVVDGGKKATVRFEAQAAVSATEASDSDLRLANANPEQVFDAYARISDRTVRRSKRLRSR